MDISQELLIYPSISLPTYTWSTKQNTWKNVDGAALVNACDQGEKEARGQTSQLILPLRIQVGMDGWL